MAFKKSITLNDVVVVSPRQVSTTLGEQTMILGGATGEYFGLDEVGSHVWAQLQNATAVSRICEAVMAEYAVDAAECARDVLELLGELQDKGLIHVQHVAGAS